MSYEYFNGEEENRTVPALEMKNIRKGTRGGRGGEGVKIGTGKGGVTQRFS